MADHPGGKDAIMLFAGKDATEEFDMLHQPSVLLKFGKDLYVGDLQKWILLIIISNNKFC